MIYVPDGAPLKSTGKQYFSALAGMAEDPTKFKYFGIRNKETDATNIIRGLFCSYVGCENELPKHEIINIHTPGYSNSLTHEYFKVRFNTLSSYYPISDRYDIRKIEQSYHNNITKSGSSYEFTEYRGDCYINTVTMRINRNFLDSETPINNEIVDVNNWKNNYLAPNDASKTKDNSKLNRPDINAIELGHWVTFKVCSTFNLALRSLDNSNVDEAALLGKPRGFFPIQEMSSKAENKMAESELYNIGYSMTTGSK